MASKKRKKKRRNRRRRRGSVSPALVVGIVVAALAVVGLVVWGFSSIKPGSQKALCSLLLDRTSSAQGSQTTGLYSKIATDAVSECAQLDGTMTIWSFGGQSGRNEVLGTFPLYGVGTNSPVRNRSRENEVTAANRAINTALHQGGSDPSKGSDIVSAVNQAASTMTVQSQRTGTKAKYMVVLTDGMQLADGVSVDSLSSVTQDPKLLVADAERVNPQFDLSGVNVSFLGVSSGKTNTGGKQVPVWFEQKVRQFWTGLVDDGHGKVCAYQADQASGSVLLGCGA